MVGYETSIWLPLAWKYLTPILTMVKIKLRQNLYSYVIPYYYEMIDVSTLAFLHFTDYTPLLSN